MKQITHETRLPFLYQSLIKRVNKIIESRKHPVPGQFILERHRAKGSIFIESKEGNICLVKGLTDPWSVTLANRTPPILLNTTPIPFRDCIIPDGLTMA